MLTTNKPHKTFRALVDTYESIQKQRIGAENRLRNIELGRDESDELRANLLIHLTKLKEIEKAVLKDAEGLAREVPVYREFLSKVKGIGPSYTIKLLGLPLELGKPLSAWNAYFGLVPGYWLCVCEKGHRFMSAKEPLTCSVHIGDSAKDRQKCGSALTKTEYVSQAPRRRSGYKSFWNPKARSLYFNIAKQFTLLGNKGFYGKMYRKFKERIQSRADLKDLPQIRKDAMAKRSAFKLFLAHYYQAYHELEGLSYRLPYAFEYLNHSEFISWQEVVKAGG